MYCTAISHGPGSSKEGPSVPCEIENKLRKNLKNNVLIANDPLSYREAIGAVLRESCARCEVSMVEPEALDREVARLAPGVVVCSRATTLVREKAFVWVELYPDGGRLAVVSIGGRRSTIQEIQLEDLLSVVSRGVNRARA